MSNKPIFVATHPRACSTAFERVFMTRRDILTCVHEPFGDAFYFGPERLSARYENDEKGRSETGFSESTFKTILDRIDTEGSEGKRLFIKDITHYLVPPHGKAASIAPSLLSLKKGVGTSKPQHTTNGEANGTVHGAPYPYQTLAEPGNPTVIPEAVLKKFHFTFLIRHPRSSIPSYYRCTIPPLDKVTGFYDFMPSEAGYDELRRVFDYLRSVGQVGPTIAGRDKAHSNGMNGVNGHSNGTNGVIGDDIGGKVDICVVDADDLLDNPSGIIEAYCKSVGIDYDEGMLDWDNPDDHKQAKDAFEKWDGFHNDAIESSCLKQRLHKKKVRSDEDEDRDWTEKYGEKGAKIIRDCVNANIADYEYLKSFAIKV